MTFDALYDNRSRTRRPASGRSSTFAERGSDFSDGFLHTDVQIARRCAPYTAADCPRYGPAAGDNCGGGRDRRREQSGDPASSQAAPDGAGAADPGAERDGPATPASSAKIEGLLGQLGSEP